MVVIENFGFNLLYLFHIFLMRIHSVYNEENPFFINYWKSILIIVSIISWYAVGQYPILAIRETLIQMSLCRVSTLTDQTHDDIGFCDFTTIMLITCW